jgi:hypothetical protein
MMRFTCTWASRFSICQTIPILTATGNSPKAPTSSATARNPQTSVRSKALINFSRIGTASAASRRCSAS